MQRLKRRRVSLEPQPPLLPVHRLTEVKGIITGASSVCGKSLRGRHSLGWASLPLELLLLVFCFLKASADRQAVLLTCRSWYAAMSDHSLWKESRILIKRPGAPLKLWNILRLRQISSVSLQFSRIHKLQSIQRAFTRLCKVGSALTSLNVRVKELCGLDKLSIVKQLKRLSLSLHQFQQTDLTQLQSLLSEMPDLLALKLSSVIQCDHVSVTLQHSRLQQLTLENVSLQGQWKKGAPIIAADDIPSLETLELINCTVKGAILVGRSKETLLHPFKLTALSWVQSASLLPLYDGFKFTSHAISGTIKVLDLSFCKFEERELQQLVSDIVTITSLDLSGNGVSDALLKTIAEQCGKLTSIRLGACQDITATGVRELGNLDLQHLGLARCVRAGTPALLLELPHLFPQITSLDLSGWDCLNDANLHLMTALVQLKTLTVCGINSISEDAITAFRLHFGNKVTVLH